MVCQLMNSCQNGLVDSNFIIVLSLPDFDFLVF